MDFDEKVYTKIGMQDLILFGILSVISSGETCTFERLVAECFRKFPKVFSFKRYPDWPDSLMFDRPLRTLRHRGLIVGGAKDHFQLTEFGKKKAREVGKNLTNEKIVKHRQKSSPGRSIDDRLIAYLKETPQFKAFQKNSLNLPISELELRNIFRCTLETPLRVLKQNLEYCKNLAELYKEKELLNFLSFCEDHLPRGGKKNG